LKHILRTTVAVTALTIGLSLQANADTMMLKEPAASKKHIAFTYGGDIWIADRKGNNPRRLTSRPAPEQTPHFSPDGKTIAFTATYDGNTDVYTVPVTGGQPKRLTWHPGSDRVQGWAPNGKEVLFTSKREMTSGRSAQAWHVSTKGGLPNKVMDAVIQSGSWDKTGKRLAYQPYSTGHRGAAGWRNHRGGTTPPIWIINPASGDLEKVPHVIASDTNPMWVGDDVYFLSDRDNVRNIWRYDSSKKTVEQVTKENDWDIESATAQGNIILYATTAGVIKELDTKRGKTQKVSITVNSDFPETRPQWKDAMKNLSSFQLSPTAKRAVIAARGDVYTVPIENGSTRNLTNTSGAKEDTALWSPKGDEIAYLSDISRKWALVITDQKGGVKNSYELGDADYTLNAWSADGGKIIFSDNHLNVYFLDTKSGKQHKIYTDNIRNTPAISLTKDGKWMAYIKARANQFNDVYLYNFETETHTLITDGMSHAASPAFSPDGKYLYFAASTNSGLTQIGLDLSTQERPQRFGIYVVVLAADGASPLLPKSGDETPQPDKDASDDAEKNEDKEAEQEEKNISVDTAAITDRIVALPIAERNYSNLKVAHDGALFFVEVPQPGISIEPESQPFSGQLIRFDFEKNTAEKVMDRIQGFEFSADGKTIIAQTPGNILRTGSVSKKIETTPLNTSAVKAFITPREEWAQIFDEVWRLEKQYFYAENMHGLDWDGVYKKYQPLLKHVATRAELNRVLVEMIAELQVGHNNVGAGDVYRDKPVNTGLLGADLRVENGKYRIKRIFTGEKWNPFLTAPLAAPGIGIKEGDYIHAVNGKKITSADNIYASLIGTVGNQVTLSVSTDGNIKNAKEATVVPIDNESTLRHWAWVENNRKHVEKVSDGKVGYIYLPDTAGGGFTYFNRMFFAQADKKALVIDERRNSGGQAANYIIDVLSRKHLAGWKDRDGMVFNTPGGGIYGPKVMLIDQDAGSGGDFLPYAFKHIGLGKLVGKTTWGGLIGISANPSLIDGGFLTVPFFRVFSTENKWFIENEGVRPDIDIDLDPTAVNVGTDTQLDKAIEEVLKDLETFKPVKADKAPPLPTEVGK